MRVKGLLSERLLLMEVRMMNLHESAVGSPDLGLSRARQDAEQLIEGRSLRGGGLLT
jgi:hypothetical protein